MPILHSRRKRRRLSWELTPIYRYDNSRSLMSDEDTSKRRGFSFRPSTRRWTLEKLHDAIHDKIMSSPPGTTRVFAELFAVELRAKKDMVVQVFATLNREGVLEQRVNIAAHDSRRNRIFGGGCNDWAASYYPLTDRTWALLQSGK